MKNQNDESPLSGSILFTFTESGHLRAILLNAHTETDQEVLKTALDQLIKPSRLGWLRRLFR